MSGASGKVIDQPRISIESLEDCQRSAEFWTENIGQYGSRLQQKADNYTIAAVILSTITGLAVWPLLTSTTTWWAQLIVSVMALVAAFVAIVPKTRNYSDGARTATKLAAEYGHHLGALNDALASLKRGDQVDEAALNGIRNAFEATRAEKQALRPFPADLQDRRSAEKAKYKQAHEWSELAPVVVIR